MPPRSLPQQSFAYRPSLDVLRSMAVGVVLLVHGSYELFAGGWIAVDVFFVLSGYLITSLLLQEHAQTGRISISHFYARRFLRLLPALFITICLGNALWSYTDSLYDGVRGIANLSAILYFVNLVKANVAGNFGHLWSLSVEEHFYLSWPLIMLLLVRVKRSKAIIIIAVLIALIAVVKIVYALSGVNIEGKYFVIAPHLFTPFKIDAILLGCLLAFTNFSIVKNSWRNVLAVLLFVSSICIICFVSNKSFAVQAGGFLLTNLFSLLAVVYVKDAPQNFVWSNKWLLWIGKRSYGIYVYHLPIFALLDNYRIPHNRPWFAFLFLSKCLLTIALAALSYRYVEKPFLAMKKRFGAG